MLVTTDFSHERYNVVKAAPRLVLYIGGITRPSRPEPVVPDTISARNLLSLRMCYQRRLTKPHFRRIRN